MAFKMLFQSLCAAYAGLADTMGWATSGDLFGPLGYILRV